ncbi:hypothetical protein LJB71_01420 [Thermomonas sp. S9]|uniref:hypothetical protein n=1 Tax=Thermomonas sp. S9 TaxID=2885203 RepID=UPI00216B54E8|nr:hypothetical protein [Thermomonas sp. S9]MCR6495037.1 hypothetical protein [Thermomonas sp. S9]
MHAALTGTPYAGVTSTIEDFRMPLRPLVMLPVLLLAACANHPAPPAPPPAPPPRRPGWHPAARPAGTAGTAGTADGGAASAPAGDGL